MKILLTGFFCFLLATGAVAQQLKGMEYAFDTDPGPGNGTYVPLPAVSNVDSVFRFNTSSLNFGLHTLYLRFKDTADRWSVAQTKQFFLTQGNSNYAQSLITGLDYFLDSLGSVHYTYNFPSGLQNVDDSITLNFPGAAPGVHMLYIRTRSNNNNNLTSHYIVKPVHLINGTVNNVIARITALEYALDTGNVWTSVPVAPPAIGLDDTLRLDLANVTPGLHTLHTRVRNEANLFSHYTSQSIVVTPGSVGDSLVAAEVFFDTDPGFDNGIPVTFTAGKEIDTTFSLTVPAGLANGDHIMYVRTKAHTGNWGHYKADTIKICEQLPPVAGFDVVQFGSSISFVDTSKHGTDYLWNFGDNSIDTTAFPIHNYNIGSYEVLQIVSNTCLADTAVSNIVVEGTESYSPKSGGVGGDVLVSFYGAGLDTTVQVTLQNGTSTIKPIKKKKVSSQELLCTFDFHLVNQLGNYDVNLIFPNNTVSHFANGFYIDSLKYPKCETQLVGPATWRSNRWTNFNLVVKNPGNVDAKGVVVDLIIPDEMEIQFDSSKYWIDTTTQFSFVVDSLWSINMVDTVNYTMSAAYNRFVDSAWLNLYVRLDTFNNLINAKCYTLMIPYVQAEKEARVNIKLKSLINGTLDIYHNAGSVNIYGSPTTLQALDNMEAAGFMVADGIVEAFGYLPDDIKNKPSVKEIEYAFKATKATAGYMAPLGTILGNWYSNTFEGGETPPDYYTNLNDQFEMANERFTSSVQDELIGLAADKVGELIPQRIKFLRDKQYSNVQAIRKSGAITDAQWLTYIRDKQMLFAQQGRLMKLDEVAQNTIKAAKTLQQISGTALTLLDYKNRYEQINNCPETDRQKEYLGSQESLNDFVRNRKRNNIVNSMDPNEIYGPVGSGDKRYVKSNELFYYQVSFENVDTALAPAQRVTIYNYLDTNKFDLSSFYFSDIKVSGNSYYVGNKRKEFSKKIDLRPTLPLELLVTGRLDTISGLITMNYISLDTIKNNIPDDPLLGFLLPNHNPPEGEGSFSYLVKLKNRRSFDDSISNQAIIYFDENDSIATNIWENRVDDLAPNSTMMLQELPGQTIGITFNGHDLGSGINGYHLFFKVNGGAFQYKGFYNKPYIQLVGDEDSTYSFYTEAVDNVGNRESKQPVAEATITLTKTRTTSSSKEFICFPVPTQDELNIVLSRPVDAPVSIHIYDMVGRKVYSGVKSLVAGTTEKVSIGHLASGIYVVKVALNNGMVLGSQKIVVAK